MSTQDTILIIGVVISVIVLSIIMATHIRKIPDDYDTDEEMTFFDDYEEPEESELATELDTNLQPNLKLSNGSAEYTEMVAEDTGEDETESEGVNPPQTDMIEETAETPQAITFDSPLPDDVDAVLREVCEESGVPYELALGLIEIESNFWPDALNSSGCYGYCQLNPRYFPSDLSPADNIRHGIGWLGDLIKEYGDVAAALTSYNAGYDTGDREYAIAVIASARDWGYDG